MSDITNLTCPSCGGKLQITPDIDRFACGHCGNEHIVKRGGGIISLAPVVEGLKEVRSGVDKTASELAIKRLQKEVASLTDQRTRQQASWVGTRMWLCMVAPMVLVLFSIFGFLIDPVVGILLLIISIVITYRLFTNRNNRNQEEKIKLASMDGSIRKKETELQYHQRIVSGR